jgi:hypothetical protein
VPKKISAGAVDSPEQAIELAAVGTAAAERANVGYHHDRATRAQGEDDNQLTHDSNTLWIPKPTRRSRGLRV